MDITYVQHFPSSLRLGNPVCGGGSIVDDVLFLYTHPIGYKSYMHKQCGIYILCIPIQCAALSYGNSHHQLDNTLLGDTTPNMLEEQVAKGPPNTPRTSTVPLGTILRKKITSRRRPQYRTIPASGNFSGTSLVVLPTEGNAFRARGVFINWHVYLAGRYENADR